MAFPMPLMGTTHMASILIAAENPARASEPKLFTTDCTSIIPMDTVDCCKIDGRDIFAIGTSSPKSKGFALTGASFLN